MVHSCPRQRLSDQRWDYTRGGHATGYCEPNGGGEKYHADGHATAEEACECFKQYRLDNVLRFQEDNPNANQQHRCKAEGCKNFTSGYAQIGGYTLIVLCAEHRTREVVEGLYTVGESWES